MARGKRFRAAIEKVDRNHAYEPGEAVTLLKQTASARFDETVELHVRLGVNVRHAEEQVRGTLALPHGTGGDVTIAVFATGDKAREATEAGADFVGSDDLAERVEAGWTDFDVAIATPDQMPVVGKLGRVLGPQGLMPNPKVGTVTNDVGKAVSESKSGKVEYRTDRQSVIHLAIGKASFDPNALLENYAAVIDEIVKAKPAAAKGRYLISVTLTTTMGPGIKLDTAQTTAGEVLAAAGVIEDPADLAEASNGSGAAEVAEEAVVEAAPEVEADAEAEEPEVTDAEPDEPEADDEADDPDDHGEAPEGETLQGAAERLGIDISEAGPNDPDDSEE